MKVLILRVFITLFLSFTVCFPLLAQTSVETQADVIERVSPSVVHILVEQKGGKVFSGTGFVCKSGGFILTCNHVIENAQDIIIHLSDGRELPAKKVRNVKELDLALLKVKGDLPDPLPRSKAKIRAGDEILVIGFPDSDLLGEDIPTVTKGMLSAVRFNGAIIQIDAAINPGNSGGPILNHAGEVVGVVVFRLKGSSGLNFGTGIATASPLLEKAEPDMKPKPPDYDASPSDETGEPKPGAVKVNPKDGAEMVYVPSGEFTMGDEDQYDNPPHKVYLDGFYIYKNLVTVAQYKAFCDVTGRQMPAAPSWGWKDDHPIVNVNWDDAKAYCDWAVVRLPTEAEWEKAARGTDGRKYPWGNVFDLSRLWCSKSAFGDAENTAPVGSFSSGASPYGALDMAGNVWQWVADSYDLNYPKSSPSRNPTGPGFGTQRVLRGGSWSDYKALYFRAAYRYWSAPVIMFNGFRCVSKITVAPPLTKKADPPVVTIYDPATGETTMVPIPQPEPTAPPQTDTSESPLQAVGRLGKVIVDTTRIFAAPDKKPIYSIVPRDTYVVLVGQRGNHYAVLMADGRYGWVRKSRVSLLNYDVVTGKTGDPAVDFGNKLVQDAFKYLGLPYKKNGYSTTGTDDSGFIKAVYARNGIALPRMAREQAKIGQNVAPNDLRPGDRVYFSFKGQYIDHTGMYIGNGYFIHNSTNVKRVVVDLLTSHKYWSHLICARR